MGVCHPLVAYTLYRWLDLWPRHRQSYLHWLPLPYHLPSLATSTFPSWSSGLALPPTTTAFTWPQTVPWMTPPTNVDGPSHHLLGQVPAPNGLILSPMTEPIGPKLVHRIRSGQFVEMRELLPDNMALHQNLEAMHGHLPFHSMSGSVRPRFWEVASPLTWITCFLTYLAVSTADDCTRDQLCYARLLLQEASRHGGSGWMEYDRVFRKQAAIDSSLPWNSLQPGLHASSILSQRSSSEGMFCALCKGPDHLAAQCALAYLQQPAVPHSYHRNNWKCDNNDTVEPLYCGHHALTLGEV